MIAGQVHDLEGERQPPNAELLETIHRAKTGALLSACVRGGAILGGASEADLPLLTRYASAIGLAFQVVDDVLDATAGGEQLGKTAGKDEAAGKATYVSIHGLERSHEMAEQERVRCHEALSIFDDRARWLRELADLIVHRKN